MTHETFMNRALELAEKAKGLTSPNPLVGCVINIDNQIIGEGFHSEFGGPHAEVNAINSVSDKNLLKDATAYVTLEPCSHHGKTPPCAELLVKHNLKEVVICNTDPNSKVAGRGIKFLRKNGIKVVENVLSEKGEWLNRRFFTSHRKKRPYIILKWAQNQNGFMDKERTSDNPVNNWITTKELKSLTHVWRAQEDAILVGANTVLNDSPSLNLRHASRKDPLRIVIDLNGKIPEGHNFWKQELETISCSLKHRNLPKWIQQVNIRSKETVLSELLAHLHEMQINSLIVEGGAFTLQQFIEQNLWDEARILSAQNDWTSGLKAPEISGESLEEFRIGKNQIKIITKT